MTRWDAPLRPSRCGVASLPRRPARLLAAVLRRLVAPARACHTANDSDRRMDRISRHRGPPHLTPVMRNPRLVALERRIERRFSLWTIRPRALPDPRASPTRPGSADAETADACRAIDAWPARRRSASLPARLDHPGRTQLSPQPRARLLNDTSSGDRRSD